MILKLVKYDIRGIGKKLLPLYGLALVLSLINKINDRLLLQPLLDKGLINNQSWLNILSSILKTGYVISILAVFIITFFILIAKYNRSVFGDEAYLTHTLPISQSQIIIAKTINFLFWSLMSFLVAGVSTFILYYSQGIWTQIGFLIREMWTSLQYIFASSMNHNKLALVLFLLMAVLSPLSEIFKIYLSIGLGNKFKHKLAAGVVAYLAINTLLSSVFGIITSDISSRMVVINNFNSTHFTAEPNFLPLMLTLLILEAFEVVVMFQATKYIQEKQLNLE